MEITHSFINLNDILLSHNTCFDPDCKTRNRNPDRDKRQHLQVSPGRPICHYTHHLGDGGTNLSDIVTLGEYCPLSSRWTPISVSKWVLTGCRINLSDSGIMK